MDLMNESDGWILWMEGYIDELMDGWNQYGLSLACLLKSCNGLLINIIFHCLFVKLSISFMYLQTEHLTHGGLAAVTRSTFTGAALLLAFRNVHVALSATAPTPDTTATVMPTRNSGKSPHYLSCNMLFPW